MRKMNLEYNSYKKKTVYFDESLILEKIFNKM